MAQLVTGLKQMKQFKSFGPWGTLVIQASPMTKLLLEGGVSLLITFLPPSRLTATGQYRDGSTASFVSDQ
jgi:hypothetical protein